MPIAASLGILLLFLILFFLLLLYLFQSLRWSLVLNDFSITGASAGSSSGNLQLDLSKIA